MSDSVQTPTSVPPAAAKPPAPAAPEPPAPADSEGKKFKFPTAFTVLAAVLLLVWIDSVFIVTVMNAPTARTKKKIAAEP